jgi:hypothetical protein
MPLRVTPERSRPRLVAMIPEQSSKQPWAWGRRIGIAAVVLVLIGLFVYSARATTAKSDRTSPARTVNASAAMFGQYDRAGGGSVDQKEITVYITRTGTKYHCEGCRHLSKSKIPVKLNDAKKHHGPCSVCKPPQ